MTLQQLSVQVSLSVSKIWSRIKLVLHRTKKPLVARFFPATIENSSGLSSFRYNPLACGAVDATVIRICRPKDYDSQIKYYDRKHKYHSLNFNVL